MKLSDVPVTVFMEVHKSVCLESYKHLRENKSCSHIIGGTYFTQRKLRSNRANEKNKQSKTERYHSNDFGVPSEMPVPSEKELIEQGEQYYIILNTSEIYPMTVREKNF
jgi:hypothetical protein